MVFWANCKGRNKAKIKIELHASIVRKLPSSTHALTCEYLPFVELFATSAAVVATPALRLLLFSSINISILVIFNSFENLIRISMLRQWNLIIKQFPTMYMYLWVYVRVCVCDERMTLTLMRNKTAWHTLGMLLHRQLAWTLALNLARNFACACVCLRVLCSTQLYCLLKSVRLNWIDSISISMYTWVYVYAFMYVCVAASVQAIIHIGCRVWSHGPRSPNVNCHAINRKSSSNA